jgi:energy-coupling factor transport system permease protein
VNLQSVIIGQYYPGKSFIHRLDPRTKILAIFLLSILIFFPKSWPGYMLMSLLSAAAVALSRVPVGLILRGLRPILILLAITVLFNAFFTPGEPLFSVGSWVVTREGIYLSIAMALRLILLMTVASLLTLTTSPIHLTDGMERLLRPFAPLGVPAHELALMMTIALRFIPTLVEEADRIMRAQSARGADFRSGNVLNRLKSLVPVLIPLFVAAFRRADDLATAMEARGYRGGHGRTKMKQLAFSPLDFWTAVFLALFAAVVIYLRIAGLG